MRTTLDIDDDVLQMAKELARAEKKTAGAVISDLARKALTTPAAPLDVSRLEIVDGIPVLPSRGGVVTNELVDRLLEEADLEDAGLLNRDVMHARPFRRQRTSGNFRSDHASHLPARGWWAANAEGGWATCPLTQNGFTRIMSQSELSGPSSASRCFGSCCRSAWTEPGHEFWPDDVSIVDPGLFDHTRILGPKQLTDIYLLALAVKHGGRLVTFDRTVPLAAVRQATPDNLVIL